MRLRLSLILVAAWLGGCATTIPAGRDQGRLVLHESLSIPPGAATVRLQYGGIVPRNSVQEQDPFCVFELDTVASAAQTVQPGRFAITGINRSVETFAGMPVFGLRRVSFGGDDGPTHIYYKTAFRLRDDSQAARQPVRALTCMSNQNAPGNDAFMHHLSLREMRAALGAAFTLELNP